jgi:23S rRNA pseudouridine1911/1915/1917 synthase
MVSGEQAGLTLAAVVRELAPGTSWSQARDLCRNGRVWVDGEPATDPARRLAGGERVEVRSAAPRNPDLIVHLDADVAVVRKPAGILTVPFERQDRDTLLALARVAIRRMEAARRSAGTAPNPTLRAVQRLDKDTSGLVVFARSVHAQRHLQEQLAEHSVVRRYLAIAHGEVQSGTHESLLVPDRGDGLRGSWRGRGSPPSTARQAITYIRVEERLRGATLAVCELETGRQHQIRIHLAEAGHPLVGETVYIRDYRGPLLPAPRPMLHAAALGFLHPRGDRPMEFEEPPPADFLEVLERLKP